jgi:4-amino-4-deoxy-L-arabinose transferase-like glycosyltransferase
MGLILITYKILNELKLKDKYKIFVISIMAFHPTFIILSGSINNDILCLLLVMWSILRLMKWYKKTDIKNTTFLAVIIGLAVMTKISGALVAIPTIYIFLLKLYKDIKKSDKKDIVAKKYFYLYIYFGCISLPIGLWYAVRNYILFNQPLVYIMDIHNADLYAGDVSIFRRLIPFSSEIFNMYCNMLGDKNIIIFLIKNSLFGEYTWQKGGIFNVCYVISILTNIIMILISLYSIIRNMMRREKRNIIWKIFFVILYLFNIISYISMNNNLPYTCSMDFRYMFPTLFVGVLFIAFELSSIKRKNSKYEKVFYNIIMCISYILMISSDIIIMFSKIV